MSKRRSKAEWQRLIDEQAASGLGRKAFCEGAGIALSTFAYWKRKLRDEGALHSEGQVGSQSVTLDEWVELTPPATEPAAGWYIELDLGDGVCLRLRRG